MLGLKLYHLSYLVFFIIFFCVSLIMAFVGIRDCAQFLAVKAMAASRGSENATGLKFESSTLRKPLPTYHCIWCKLIDYSYLTLSVRGYVCSSLRWQEASTKRHRV